MDTQYEVAPGSGSASIHPDGADILVVGEALVDVVTRADGSVDESPGGSPANVAVTLGRLGRAPRLLCSLGDDASGTTVREWLGSSQVRQIGGVATRTSTATATLDRAGAARYGFDLCWEADFRAAGEPDLVHVGSIAAVLPPSAPDVARLVDRCRGRALVSVDPNIRPALVDEPVGVRARVESLIARADVVKASDDDMRWLHPGETPAEVARGWAAAGPALVVVTLGRDGAIAVFDDTELRIEGVPVDVVDTVGAGDTFMGALLDALVEAGAVGSDARGVLERLDASMVCAALERAARAAAITVGRAGADPPTRLELDGPAPCPGRSGGA
ncbi:ribokinase [Agromyces rhizosphaerae]|uniref:Ribokinase n=1 Tax=Agromyces rhizosphaerae TaxID=88374 RepID=A0A9W6FP61_9MICO|nr:ribokinase [Agromyces rhizosphaerae]